MQCRTNDDRSMLINMNIKKKMNLMDCIALNGRCSLYDEWVINVSDLNKFNFVYPIRKDKNINLNDVEKDHNEEFGNFLPEMEKVFSDIGFIFLILVLWLRLHLWLGLYPKNPVVWQFP